MKINFMKGTATGRVLIVMYLVVCIVEGYNVFPIRELTTDSIKRYNAISERAMQKLGIITQIRLNLDNIEKAKFMHIINEDKEAMRAEILEINHTASSNDSLFKELRNHIVDAEEETLYKRILENRWLNMESRKHLLRLSMGGEKEKAIEYYQTTNEQVRLDYGNSIEALTEHIVAQTKRLTEETSEYIIEKRKPVDAVLLLSVILVVITGLVVFAVNRKLNMHNEVLALQQKKYFDMVDSTDEMMATHNDKGEIIWANRSWKENTGYTDEDISRGLRAVDILDDATRPLYVQRFSKIMRGEKLDDAEGTIITKSGEKIFVYGKSKPVVTEGKITGLQSFLRNITVRKKAEEKLIETSMRLQNVLNIFDNSFWGYDVVNQKMLYVSPGNEKVFGYPEKDFLANGNLWFECVLDEDKPKFEEVWKKLYAGKSVQHDFRIRMPDGAVKWVESKMAPSIDASGKLSSIDGIAIDISERKNAAAVIEKNLAELKKTNEELDHFVYSTSHDLRAPVLAIEGLLDLSDEHIDNKDELTAYLNTMRKIADQMDDTIREILNYSRNARLNIIPERIDVNKIVETTRNQITQTHLNSNISFSCTVDDAQPFFTDKMRFTAVIHNLLVNAFKYTRDGEEHPFVKVTFRSDASEGILTVEDNGEGIPPEHLGKIFDMFYRVSEKSDSSGLGLYICREITEKLHGTIDVDSVPGKGSIFTVRIPNVNSTIQS